MDATLICPNDGQPMENDGYIKRHHNVRVATTHTCTECGWQEVR